MASRAAIGQCLHRLTAAGYAPPKAPLPDIAAIWLEVLSDLPDEQVIAATVAYIRGGSEWWPKPGQIRAQLAPDSASEAVQAYGAAVCLAARHGRTSPPSRLGYDGRWRMHTDSAIESAMLAGVASFGGWAAFCAASPTWNDNQKRFVLAYVAARQSTALVRR